MVFISGNADRNDFFNNPEGERMRFCGLRAAAADLLLNRGFLSHYELVDMVVQRLSIKPQVVEQAVSGCGGLPSITTVALELKLPLSSQWLPMTMWDVTQTVKGTGEELRMVRTDGVWLNNGYMDGEGIFACRLAKESVALKWIESGINGDWQALPWCSIGNFTRMCCVDVRVFEGVNRERLRSFAALVRESWGGETRIRAVMLRSEAQWEAVAVAVSQLNVNDGLVNAYFPAHDRKGRMRIFPDDINGRLGFILLEPREGCKGGYFVKEDKGFGFEIVRSHMESSGLVAGIFENEALLRERIENNELSYKVFVPQGSENDFQRDEVYVAWEPLPMDLQEHSRHGYTHGLLVFAGHYNNLDAKPLGFYGELTPAEVELLQRWPAGRLEFDLSTVDDGDRVRLLGQFEQLVARLAGYGWTFEPETGEVDRGELAPVLKFPVPKLVLKKLGVRDRDW